MLLTKNDLWMTFTVLVFSATVEAGLGGRERHKT